MAIKILSSENITGNITLHSPTNAPYIDFVENADTGDSKARITMDQIDTNNAKLFISTENSGTLTNAVVIDNSQNVGIGNFTNPTDGNLVVKKDGLNTGIPNSLTSASFSESGGQLKGLTIGYRTDETTAVIAARTATGDIAFMGYNGGWLETARFTNDNRLGIGSTTPEKKLHILTSTTDDTPQVLIQNGSSGDASLTFNVSGQSYVVGIDHDDSSKFKIAASGNLGTNDRVTLLSSGNVGIGTISPIAPLHVVTPAVGGIDLTNISRTANNLVRFTNPEYSTSATMGLLLRVFPDSDARQGAGLLMTGGSDNAASNLTLFVSKDDGTSSNVSQSYSALHIAGNTGNVGIGVTSPGAKLEVDGSTNAIIKMNSTAGTGGRMDFVHAGSIYGNIGSARNILGTGNAADMMINADSLLILGVGSQDMTILPSGNVGIGTTSPSRKLVVAQSNVTEPSGIDANTGILIKNNTWSGIQIISTEATGGFITFGDNAAGFAGRIQYLHATNAMVFETAASERMRITSGGFLQIQNRLTFRGISSSQAANILTDETSTGTGLIRIQAGGGSAAYGGGINLYANAAGTKAGDVAVGLSAVAGAVFRVNLNGVDTSTDVLTMTRSGNMTITGTLTQNSDIRIKENIKPLESQLDIISKLNPVSYNKKENKETLEPFTGQKEIGFIAQEVEEILPELVSENKEGIKSLAYGNMNAVLVKAIQELKAEVEILKNK